MTPEERAEQLIDDMPYRFTGNHDCGDVPDLTAFYPLLAAAIRAAVEAERARLLDLFSKRMGLSVKTLLEHLPELGE